LYTFNVVKSVQKFNQVGAGFGAALCLKYGLLIVPKVGEKAAQKSDSKQSLIGRKWVGKFLNLRKKD